MSIGNSKWLIGTIMISDRLKLIHKMLESSKRQKLDCLLLKFPLDSSVPIFNSGFFHTSKIPILAYNTMNV